MTAASIFDNSITPEEELQKYLRQGDISEADAEIIRKYIAYRQATRGIISSNTLKKNIKDICSMQRIPPASPISELTTDIIYARIRNMHEKYSQNTRAIMLITNKSFWKYLAEHKIAKLDLKKIKKIRGIPINYETTAANEILTPAEVLQLISHAGSARNRAFVATLYESAGRISEVANLKWQDISFDTYGAGVRLPDFKSRQTRYARLIIAAPHLLEWRNTYERSSPASGENFVFITNRNTPIGYFRYQRMLKEIAQRAGINKRVHLHLLRKSRITHLTKDGYSESIIKKLAWGNQNTSMLRTYSVLSERDIDQEFLQRSGLQDSELPDTEVLHPAKCIRCGTMITPDQHYCSHCGLSKDADLIDPDLSVDPELIARVLKILQSQKRDGQ